MSVQELLYLNWVCCAVHHDLAVRVHIGENVLDVNLEVLGE